MENEIKVQYVVEYLPVDTIFNEALSRGYNPYYKEGANHNILDSINVDLLVKRKTFDDYEEALSFAIDKLPEDEFGDITLLERGEYVHNEAGVAYTQFNVIDVWSVKQDCIEKITGEY